MARTPYLIPYGDAEIVVAQGADYEEHHALFDDDGNIFNTTGFTATMAVKDREADTATLISTADSTPTTITLLTGVTGTEEASTTLASAASADDTTVTVASATGIAVGQQVVITLDSTATHAAKVSGVAGTTLTLADPVPDAAAIGNAVVTYSNATCLTVRVHDAGTATLPDGLNGVYDLWLVDTGGNDIPFAKDSFCAEGRVAP